MTHCIICEEQKLSTFSHITRDGHSLNFQKCPSCQHIYQLQETVKEIYSNGEFSQKHRDSPSPSPEKIKEVDKRAVKRFQFYKEHFPETIHNALEIGSSIGSFLHLLKLNGAHVEGIEPDPVYSAFSQQQYGFTQENKLLEDFTPNKKFDFISSFHVIEHVPDPLAFITKMKDISAPGGTIIHEFPSMELYSWGDLKQTYWEPHLQYFNAGSVYKLFAKHFRVLKIGYYGAALYVVAKNESPNYTETEWRKYDRKAKRLKFLISIVPSIFIGKKINLKEFLFRFFIEKNTYLSKAIFFGKYAIKERKYVFLEKNILGSQRFQHLTYYRGWENAGDTILSKSVRDTFKTVHKSIRWSLDKVTEPVTSHKIDRFNQNKLIIVGGGGLFLPDTNKNNISGWQWPISKQQLEQLRAPLALFAVGYNYFPGQKPNDFFVENLNAVINKAGFIGLRNSGSINKVSELIDDHLKAKIDFQPCTTTIIRKLDKSLPAKVKTKNIALNIAFDRYEKRLGANIYIVLDQIATAMKALEHQGFKIHLTGHLQEDNKFFILLDKHKVTYKSHVLQFMTPREVYHFYNEMEVVIGMRGHAQMVPFGLNCKIITLSSHDKMRYFLEDIDALELLVDLRAEVEDISAKIIEKTNLLIQNSQKYESHFASYQDKFYQITQGNLKKIGNLIR